MNFIHLSRDTFTFHGFIMEIRHTLLFAAPSIYYFLFLGCHSEIAHDIFNVTLFHFLLKCKMLVSEKNLRYKKDSIVINEYFIY